MEFPIIDLLDQAACEQWILDHFHPKGLCCPRCGAGVVKAHPFRQTRKSGLQVYRCNRCQQIYNLYSKTIFQQRQLTPRQVVLLVRGILKGEPAKTLAAELELHYTTVLELRHDLQANARHTQPNTPLLDRATETDEMFQNAREKRRRTL